MAALTSKIRTVQGNAYAHWCPGCEEMHILPERWTYTGMETDKPTASPSFKHTWSSRSQGAKCCHYILTAGVLNFCSDSTHALAGQPVPLPDIPDNEKLGLPGCE